MRTFAGHGIVTKDPVEVHRVVAQAYVKTWFVASVGESPLAILEVYTHIFIDSIHVLFFT